MLLNVRRRYRPDKSGLTEAECEVLNICDAIVLQRTGRHLDGTEEQAGPVRQNSGIDRRKMARRLRALRGARYIEEIASACGISRSAMAMYETGRRIPKDDIKMRLAQYYGTTVQEIFYGE